MPINLHCHSLFSVDGWLTPEEIADAMGEAGITTLSLTDHNTVDGLSRCRRRARQLGIRFIDGIEFDGLWRAHEYHLLAFGPDADNPALRRLCERQFRQYAINFERFLPIVTRRYGVTRRQLQAGLPERYRTHPAPVLNKWFARGFLLSRGIFTDPDKARHAMSDVATEAEGHLDRPWAWAGVPEIIETVHAAGGILLLAHPAGHRRGDLPAQLKLIEEMLALGLDGFELYHPSNRIESHFPELEAAARRLGCMVSGGSDTHGSARRPPGDPGVPDWVLDTFPEDVLAGADAGAEGKEETSCPA